MRFAWMPLISLLPLVLLSVILVQGQRIWVNNGPLYESTKLLIAGESYKAARIWNKTEEAIWERSHQLQQAKDLLDVKQRQVSARLEKFFGNEYSEEWRVCSKKHELQMAHFNRELVDKFSICRNSLDHIVEHFEQEIVQDANFLGTAAQQISELSQICKIWQLKQVGLNHGGALLCTVSGIGRINQRITKSLELCDDILLEMTSEDLDTPSCLFYHHLKMQFDEVFAQIDSCAVA